MKHFFQMLSKNIIRNVELATCEQCGVAFAPRSQMTKLESMLLANDVEMALLNYCDRCKKIIVGQSALFPTAWEPIGDGEKMNIELAIGEQALVCLRQIERSTSNDE
jgi:hypothetical protein